MYLCMYVCIFFDVGNLRVMHVCMQMCMYQWMCAWICVYYAWTRRDVMWFDMLHVFVYVNRACFYASRCACGAWGHACIYIYIYICVCLFCVCFSMCHVTYLYVCELCDVHVYVHRGSHACIHVFANACACIYDTCMYMCMHVSGYMRMN